MTQRNRGMIFMAAVLITLALGLSGCGRRGELERPPAKDQKEKTTDNQSMMQNLAPPAVGFEIDASF